MEGLFRVQSGLLFPEGLDPVQQLSSSFDKLELLRTVCIRRLNSSLVADKLWTL